MSYLGSIFSGFSSLLTGMGITFRQSLRKPVTLQYPHETPELSEAYRSAIQLVRFDETDSHDCIACMQCVKICPSYCITIEGGKIDGIKKKRASKFEMDFALCSLCGLCIDTCPTDTLEYSRLYEEAGRERGWLYDLLEPHDQFEATFRTEQHEREEVEAAAKAAKKEAAAKLKAEKAAKEAADAGDTGSADKDSKDPGAEQSS